MTRERVVIDTNVLISGLLSATSTPAQAVGKAVTKAQLVATTESLRELIEKLYSPKFDRYVRRERRDALLERVASLVEIIDVLQPIRAARDPKDAKFLEAAVNGRADVIVTGDKDLLDLNPFRGIAIVTPGEHLARDPWSRNETHD
jgi:putative PIN family toxin of toxin-antitoxin system